MKRHGSRIDPPNRFEAVRREEDYADFEHDPEEVAGRQERDIEYLIDDTHSFVTSNDSPDVAFNYSANPYRGCAHGCSYCYARPSHEYLGMNAGLDFETRILVKTKAPQLFREFLGKKSWRCEQIVFSGVTDCYQPAERKYRLTRECLSVANEANQPIGIITKNALVARDVDLLASMAERNLVHVNVSVTTLDPALAASMEPRTSVPAGKLRAIRTLSDAGVPVRVMVAPVVPGLTDMEIPKILEAVSDAGAKCAGYVLLRLPLTVEPVFREWLRRERPLEADKVENNLLSAGGGKLYNSTFGQRQVGAGPVADRIRQVFDLFKKKNGLTGLPPLDTTSFRPPKSASGQGTLF